MIPMLVLHPPETAINELPASNAVAFTDGRKCQRIDRTFQKFRVLERRRGHDSGFHSPRLFNTARGLFVRSTFGTPVRGPCFAVTSHSESDGRQSSSGTPTGRAFCGQVVCRSD